MPGGRAGDDAMFRAEMEGSGDQSPLIHSWEFSAFNWSPLLHEITATVVPNSSASLGATAAGALRAPPEKRQTGSGGAPLFHRPRSFTARAKLSSWRNRESLIAPLRRVFPRGRELI
jgi:hypothetical protein